MIWLLVVRFFLAGEAPTAWVPTGEFPTLTDCRTALVQLSQAPVETPRMREEWRCTLKGKLREDS